MGNPAPQMSKQKKTGAPAGTRRFLFFSLLPGMGS
jgi:hypothetical protein